MLLREAADALSPKMLKTRLDRILGSLIWWMATLIVAEGWNEITLDVPSIPTHPMILQKLWDW